MDFLENLKETVAEGAKVVAQKSAELVENSKVQYLIFELKTDVKKLYNELGKLTYNAVESGEDNAEEIKMKCEILSAKLAKIEALRNSGVAADFTCPSCGRKADAADSYCPSCGADMTVEADVEVIE